LTLKQAHFDLLIIFTSNTLLSKGDYKYTHTAPNVKNKISAAIDFRYLDLSSMTSGAESPIGIPCKKTKSPADATELLNIL